MARKYLFADESGNFDFRDHVKYQGASRYFAVGTMMIDSDTKMQALRNDLADLRYELLDNGLAVGDEFHAATDKQAVRDAVFDVLQDHDFRLDVTILEKAKAQPQTRASEPTFYQYAWYYHFKYFADSYFKPKDELTIVSASLGTKKSRRAFGGAVEDVVNQCTNWQVRRNLAFWPSVSDPCLQAVDYALWAVMRDVEQGDNRSRKLIETKINSVFDLWAWGRKYYYGPKAAKPKTA